MTNKTNIHNFGRFGSMIEDYATKTGEVRYDGYTYERAMRMTESDLVDAMNDAVDCKMRKAVRAAYAVARAAKMIESWRNA